jgi:thiamine-phosphate pyrophosphorylase
VSWTRPGRLHLITDSRDGLSPADVVRQVGDVLAGVGAVGGRSDAAGLRELVIQFRPADGWTDRDCYHAAVELVELCRPLGVPLLVNDRLDIAVAAGAAGGHVGAEDLPVSAARRVLGPNALLGGTARDAAGVAAALAGGADYVGVGPCYPTASKDGLPAPLGAPTIAHVRQECPQARIIAIGGVTVARTSELLTAGATGVAVIGAVWGAGDPTLALRELLSAVHVT